MTARTLPHDRTDTSAQTMSGGFRLIVFIALLLALALVMGGGGVRYGLSNLTVQLAALLLLAAYPRAVLSFWTEAPLVLKTLTALSLLLPILYLVPLPEAAWSAFPGRDLMAQSREVAGADGWSSASVDPYRTLVALTGLIVPVAIFTVGWAVPRRHLMTIGWFVVALGLITFLLGAIQVLSGGSFGTLYSERGPTGLLYGTFANRNSTGLFLVGALTLAALLPLPLARPHPSALPVRLGICALLLVGVVLTQSRTALVLAGIPVALGVLLAFSATRRRTSAARGNGPALAVIALIGLGAVAAAGTVAMAPGRVGETLERFQVTDDARQYIWEDAAYSADRFWPIGAGMGTFDEVFQVDESLENLTKRRAGRAHNDYLELAIEAGVPGLALALCWFVYVGWLAVRAGRSQFRWAGWAGGAILLAVALQSITDYPLRNQAMLATASFALLMLARIATTPDKARAA